MNCPHPKLIALAVLWAHFIYQVHYQWGSASYYNYGWAVPLLTLILFYNRLDSKPLHQSREFNLKEKSKKTRGMIIAALSLIVIVPASILSEVNVFWRVPLYLHAIPLMVLSFIWIESILGRENRQFFLFPLIFFLTMLPWPYRIEKEVIASFSGQVTQTTVVLLNSMGLNSIAAGNTIRLGDMTVGVDDACSGIRSLQALFMIGLFLGELYFLNIRKRAVLLVGATVLVFLFNTLRSTSLALLYFVIGEDVYKFWHDPVGLATFTASLAILFAITFLLEKKEGGSGFWKDNRNRILAPRFNNTLWIRGAWLWPAASVATIIAVESWFWARNAKEEASLAQWTLQPAPGFFSDVSEIEIPDRIADTLLFDFGHRHTAISPDYFPVEAYYYGYTGEDRINSVSTYGHSPLICMSAAGAKLERVEDNLKFSHGSINLSLQHFVFQLPAHRKFSTLHVFWTVDERNNRGISSASLSSLDYTTQLKQAFLGRRDYARKILLFSVAGSKNSDKMRETAHKLLQEWVDPASNSNQGSSHET